VLEREGAVLVLVVSQVLGREGQGREGPVLVHERVPGQGVVGAKEVEIEFLELELELGEGRDIRLGEE